MTTSEMESEVASLMAERARLSRMNLELPPDKLMLLKRLLYRLGWTRMKMKRRYAKYQGLSRKAFSIVLPRSLVGTQPTGNLLKVSEYQPLKTREYGTGRDKWIWRWRRNISTHTSLADIEREHGKGIHRSDQVQGFELTPHEIWAHTNGKEGEAPPAPEQDWRPNEMIPEDYHTFRRLPKKIIKYAGKAGDHPMIRVLTHHDLLATNKADYTKRLAAADSLEDDERHEEAKLLRSKNPVRIVNGRVESGIQFRIVSMPRGSWRWQNAYTVVWYSPRYAPRARRWVWSASSRLGGKYSMPQLTRMGHGDTPQGSIHNRELTNEEMEQFGIPRTVNQPESPPGMSDVTFTQMKRKYTDSRRRFAKVDHDVKAHPLVEGFPIEHALRHLANDPKNSNNIRQLSKYALTGKNVNTGKVDDPSSALWALNDALQDEQHPLRSPESGGHGYRWMSAADKVYSDAKTHLALTEIANERKRGIPVEHHNLLIYHPGFVARMAESALRHTSMGGPAAERNTGILNQVRQRVKELQPGISDKDVDESIYRHAERHRNETSINAGGNRPRETAITPIKSLEPHEVHSRYSRLPKKIVKYERGNFLDALRRIRSTNQQSLHIAADKVARKLGLHPTKVFDALHDSLRGSTPGLVQAVYGNASPEQIHAAASWIGLTGNLPGVGVFHPRPNGPDTLYRFRQNGSGMDIRDKLDRFGIRSRILMPHRNGFDVLVPDKGSTQTKLVRNYLSTNKITSEVSKGHFHTMGSQDQAQSRDTFRKAVVKGEKTRRK